MKIYTKTGDNGKTALFGGERVWKSNKRINAYGTIDELNAVIGLTITEVKDDELACELKSIQNDLFTLGSDLATPLSKEIKNFSVPRIDYTFIEKAEKTIDIYDSKLQELKSFILPGGSKSAGLLHYARTVCRRAEREVVELSHSENIGNFIEPYLNRLSDLLFVLARYANFIMDIPDIKWERNAP